MRRPSIAHLAGLALALASLAAQAPAPTAAPVHRLGVFFWHDSPNDEATFAGIQQGLAATRWRCEFVVRRADADEARAKAMIAELRRCDLVFAMGTQAALMLAATLPDVPIVFAAVSNPVASGLVADWRGSGRKLCGGSNWVEPATVLQVFRQAMPRLERLGMLRSQASGLVSAAELATMRAYLAEPSAPSLELIEAVATDAADLPRAIADLRRQGAQAIWIPIDLTVYRNLAAIQQALGERPLPLLATAVQAARDGAMVTVTVDYALHGRRIAALADRVLQGADPGALPVDLLQGWQVVANLGAAHRCGHELPLSLLALCDVLVADPADGRPRTAR